MASRVATTVVVGDFQLRVTWPSQELPSIQGMDSGERAIPPLCGQREWDRRLAQALAPRKRRVVEREGRMGNLGASAVPSYRSQHS